MLFMLKLFHYSLFICPPIASTLLKQQVCLENVCFYTHHGHLKSMFETFARDNEVRMLCAQCPDAKCSVSKIICYEDLGSEQWQSCEVFLLVFTE